MYSFILTVWSNRSTIEPIMKLYPLIMPTRSVILSVMNATAAIHTQAADITTFSMAQGALVNVLISTNQSMAFAPIILLAIVSLSTL
jgi:hypothetical protein